MRLTNTIRDALLDGRIRFVQPKLSASAGAGEKEQNT